MTTLGPFDKVPSETVAKGSPLQTATILIVGPTGIGKRSLGRALLERRRPYQNFQIRTSATWPLPSDADGARPRTDFIVFLVNMTNVASLDFYQTTLRSVASDYCLSRSCTLVTRMDLCSQFAFQTSVVDKFAKDLSLRVFWTTTRTATQRQSVSDQVLVLIDAACGFRLGVSPLLFDTLDIHEVEVAMPSPTEPIA